jgi:hypothetical protein
MTMKTVRKRQRKNRRRKSNNEFNKKTRLKKKMRIITVLIRRKGQREQAVRKVLQQRARGKHLMKMIMGMMMTPLHRHHLSNRNSKWKINSKS